MRSARRRRSTELDCYAEHAYEVRLAYLHTFENRVGLQLWPNGNLSFGVGGLEALSRHRAHKAWDLGQGEEYGSLFRSWDRTEGTGILASGETCTETRCAQMATTQFRLTLKRYNRMWDRWAAVEWSKRDRGRGNQAFKLVSDIGIPV